MEINDMKPPVDWEAKYHAEAAQNALMRTGLIAAKSAMVKRGWKFCNGDARESYLAVDAALKEVGSVAPKGRK